MELVGSLFGYLASVLLAISLIVTNDLRFRWVNSLGCLSFIVYGILINAFPIILTNSILLLINVYRLIRIYMTQETFDMVEFFDDSQYVKKFIKFYQSDISAYFPQFDGFDEQDNLRFVVLRDMAIANMFVAAVQPDGTAIVKINYTIPKYRDFQVGNYIFKRERVFLENKGVKRLVYDQAIHSNHARFLKVMGFKKRETAGKSEYVYDLVV